MREQREAEFAEVTALAEEALKGRRNDLLQVPRPLHGLTLRLWHYPNFAPYTAWLVYLPRAEAGHEPAPIVHEITWDRPHDAQRFINPLIGLKFGFQRVPTITLREAALPNAELKRQLVDLEGIMLPAYVEDDIVGLDGESFGLETFKFISRLRATWWGDGPPTWKPLVDWATQMRQFLARSFED
jgi:hypothetical protein